jgi:hypothetical protein
LPRRAAGVIDIPRLRALAEQAGYRGPIAVEIMSQHDRWRRDPDEVPRIAKRRFAACV